MVGCLVWLPGLERLGDGVGDGVVVFTCCMVRFMPGEAIVVGGCLLGLFSGRAGFGGPLDCNGVLWISECVSFLVAWKLASDCFPPGHFCMVDLVCGVGAKCIVHNWWGHGFAVDGGSHSWHVHPSTKRSRSIGMGWGRQ